MSGQHDAAYYWIRAAEELERAEQAVNPTVAAVHHDLAYRYGARAATEQALTGNANGEADPWLTENFSRIMAASSDSYHVTANPAEGQSQDSPLR